MMANQAISVANSCPARAKSEMPFAVASQHFRHIFQVESGAHTFVHMCVTEDFPALFLTLGIEQLVGFLS